MLQQVRRGPEYVRAVSKHSGVFDLMRNKTSMHVSYHCPNPVIGMFNLLQINEKLGLPLPDWYTEEVKREHRSAYAEVMRSKAHTIRQRRLDGGPLVRTTLENMNLNGSLTNPRKIYLYSGHDMTLYGFFKALDVGDHDHVDFGTTIVLEKLRDSRNNRIFVRFLVYSPIEDKTIAVRVGGCGEFCPAEDYVKHIANVVPTDEERDVLLNEFNVGRLKDLFFVDEKVRKPSAQAREFDPYACVYKNNAQEDWNDV
ncbi:venom acid phosphatase Acph-1-like [Copidosoma floridanum]|uniref:venom acid phosphatase Acph-1-like n=1 Tax=Copidosoma floridanum TaxID=29053 RepID=UPI000C6F7EE5|nr:venom acid phosphatase Acph-1-like [Copidosoma floridanum]